MENLRRSSAELLRDQILFNAKCIRENQKFKTKSRKFLMLIKIYFTRCVYINTVEQKSFLSQAGHDVRLLLKL